MNYRDVGEWVNIIANEQLLPNNLILRSGKLNFVQDVREIGNPVTIINLRKGEDLNIPGFFGDYFHFPISNDFEKYETSLKEVRKWLNDIFITLEKEINKFPILFHCTSGKDRTGVVIAALLKILNIPDKIIIEEYLLSDGEVRKEWINNSLNNFGDISYYFNKVNLKIIRDKITPNTKLQEQ